MKQSADQQARLHKQSNAQLVAELVRTVLRADELKDDSNSQQKPIVGKETTLDFDQLAGKLPEFDELRHRGFSKVDIQSEVANLVNIVYGGKGERVTTRFSLLRSIKRIKQVILISVLVSVLLFALVFSGQLDGANAYPVLGGIAFAGMLLAFLAYSRLSIARLRLSQHESEQQELEAARQAEIDAASGTNKKDSDDRADAAE